MTALCLRISTHGLPGVYGNFGGRINSRSNVWPSLRESSTNTFKRWRAGNLRLPAWRPLRSWPMPSRSALLSCLTSDTLRYRRKKPAAHFFWTSIKTFTSSVGRSRLDQFSVAASMITGMNPPSTSRTTHPAPIFVLTMYVLSS